MELTPDLIGWIGNLFFIIGTSLLAKKKSIGWAFELLGNSAYVIQGVMVGTSSLAIISAWLAFMNYQGWKFWRNYNV